MIYLLHGGGLNRIPSVMICNIGLLWYILVAVLHYIEVENNIKYFKNKILLTSRKEQQNIFMMFYKIQ